MSAPQRVLGKGVGGRRRRQCRSIPNKEHSEESMQRQMGDKGMKKGKGGKGTTGENEED